VDEYRRKQLIKEGHLTTIRIGPRTWVSYSSAKELRSSDYLKAFKAAIMKSKLTIEYGQRRKIKAAEQRRNADQRISEESTRSYSLRYVLRHLMMWVIGAMNIGPTSWVSIFILEKFLLHLPKAMTVMVS